MGRRGRKRMRDRSARQQMQAKTWGMEGERRVEKKGGAVKHPEPLSSSSDPAPLPVVLCPSEKGGVGQICVSPNVAVTPPWVIPEWAFFILI